jgi:hypothetical protein
LHSGDVSAAADAQLSTNSERPGWTPPLGAPRLSNTSSATASFILGDWTRAAGLLQGFRRDRKRVVAFQLLHKNKESGDVIYYEVSTAAYPSTIMDCCFPKGTSSGCKFVHMQIKIFCSTKFVQISTYNIISNFFNRG